jgi:hypothetical protein
MPKKLDQTKIDEKILRPISAALLIRQNVKEAVRSALQIMGNTTTLINIKRDILIKFASFYIKELGKLDALGYAIHPETFEASFEGTAEFEALSERIKSAGDAIIKKLIPQAQFGLPPLEAQQKFIDVLCEYIHPKEQENPALKPGVKFFRTHYCAVLAEDLLRACIGFFTPPKPLDGVKAFELYYDGTWKPSSIERVIEATEASIERDLSFATLLHTSKPPKLPPCTLPEGVSFLKFESYSNTSPATTGVHEVFTTHILKMQFTQVPADFLEAFQSDILKITGHPATIEEVETAGAGAAGPAKPKKSLVCRIDGPDHTSTVESIIQHYTEYVKRDALAQEEEREALLKTAGLFRTFGGGQGAAADSPAEASPD